MSRYEWAAVLAFAGGVVEIAIEIVRSLRGTGCTVDGCPEEVEAVLMPADIPREGEAMRRARNLATRRATSLDLDDDDAEPGSR